MKLFFSYGHDENEKIILRLKQDIEYRNHSVWIDKSQIKGGDDWRRSITTGILNSDLVIFFASTHSVRKPGVCLDELRIAVSVKGALVQTVLLEANVTPPANVGHRQFIDMSSWKAIMQTDGFESWYADKLNRIIEVIENPETARQAEELEFLREQLRPSLASAKKDRLQQEYFCGREWLTQEVRDWQNNEDVSRILLIDGTPGIGKSAFMAHEFLFNASVGAILFCEWDNPEYNNLDAISRCIVFQLASKFPDYRELIVRYFKMGQQSGATLGHLENNEGVFRFLLLKQLRSLIDGDRPTVIILIDGIDELNEKNDGSRKRNAFAEMLQREIDNFPRWIRFVVTSRCDGRVMMSFPDAATIHMDQAVVDNAQDIRQYLEHEMGATLSEELIGKIVEKCDGNFLYAKMAVSALKTGKLSISDVLNGKTGDLGFIYRHYFDRTFPQMAQYEECFYPAIAALAVTEERIPASTFSKITGWSRRKQNQYLKVMSPFLSSGREYLGLYHRSLQDWLLGETADDYMVDELDGIREICEGCLQTYKESMQEMNKYELKYLVPYLEKIPDRRLEEILQDWNYADLLMRHARKESLLFQYEDAVCLAKMAWRIYKNTSHYEEVAATGLFLAETADRMVFLEESEKWCRDSLEVVKENACLTQTNLPGDIWMRLAYVYFRQGKWEKSVDCYQDAYRSFVQCKSISDNQRELKKVEAMMMSANALRNATDYTEAIRLFEEITASPIYKTLKNTEPVLYTNILMYHGWALHSAGKYKVAGEYLELAEKMLKDIDLPLKDVAQIYYLRAVELYNLADYPLAKDYCEKSLDYVKQAYGENAVEQCSALNQLGAIVQRQENYDEAIQIFKKSYEIRLNDYGENNLFTTISLRNYGKALISRGNCADVKEAGIIFEKVKVIREEIAESGKGLGWLAQIYLNLAEYYRIISHYKEAETYALNAKALYEKHGSIRDSSSCEMQLGIIKYDSGDYESARNIFEKAISLNGQCYDMDHPYSKELRMWYRKAKNKLKD